MIRRITIVSVRRPERLSLNDELQFFGHSLGLFGERDRDKSCYRIFIELIKAIKSTGSLSSDDLAEKLGLTRATVVHHLNSLMDRGIILHAGNRYVMRGDKLTSLVEDIQKDVERQMDEMRKTAEELDRLLQL